MQSLATIGDRVKWTRNKRGLTCAAVDEIADLSCGHTASIEAGRRENPSAQTIGKLASALRVDAGWLLGGGRRPTLAE